MTQFSKQEKSWILYDVANSAFTMLVSTTIPIYFRSLAEQSVSEATASGIWGLATSIAVLILAVLSPFLGALADYRGMKKKRFSLPFLPWVSSVCCCFPLPAVGFPISCCLF